MKRSLLVVVIFAATIIPLESHAAVGPVSLSALARAVPAIANASAAQGSITISERSASESLAAGDLDADGMSDVLVILASGSTQGLAFPSTDSLKLQAISGADGTLLWAREYLRQGVRDDLDVSSVAVITTGLNAAGTNDIVLAHTDLEGDAMVRVISGATGDDRWIRSDPGYALGNPNATLGFTLPLDIADANDDREDDILLGRYLGVSSSDGVPVWAMSAVWVSGRSGEDFSRPVHEVGVGVAPTAKFIMTSATELKPRVAVAGATRTRDGYLATVRLYDANPVLDVPLAEATWTTTFPAVRHAVALSMRPLPGTGWSVGGAVVSIDADDRSSMDRGLSATLVGPAVSVGLGRGGLERFRVTLPSASDLTLMPLDLETGIDVRTVRVDADSLLVETWSGVGTGGLLGSYRMSFLEADDYVKHARVESLGELGLGAGDGLLLEGGFPCGPRMQVLSHPSGANTTRQWELGEVRAYGVCDHGLTGAGEVTLTPGVDLIEWQTNRTCCLFPGFSDSNVTLRDGRTGVVRWTTDLSAAGAITGANSHEVGDTNADGRGDPAVVLSVDAGRPVVVGLDGATGAIRWMTPVG